MSEDNRRIWWLASYPKSGNTWVRMFLNAYVSGFPVNLNSAFQYASGDLMPSMYQLTAAQPIDRMNDPDSIYYRPAVLMNFLYSSGSRDIALKTHHAKIEVDGIPLVPPRLSKGALYIVRDPRDVAVSFADHTGQTVDGAIRALANREQTLTKDESKLYHILTSWSAHVDSWTLHNRDVVTSVVRYEDMLATPAKTFRLILGALGFDDVNRERFQFALAETDFQHLRDLETSGGFRETGNGEAFFRCGKSAGWKDTLSRKQAEQIEANHQHTMRRWGYLPAARNQSRLARIKSQAVGSVQ